ncbi:MAG: N-acetylmuramoyl-L-alanine amidase [Candidatus Neomarinimicrobiota bacterium]
MKYSVYRGYTACLLGRLLLPIALLPVILAADEIRVVFPNQPERRDVLRTFFLGNVEYLSSQELATIYSVNTYINDNVNKLVLYFWDGEVKITAFSSFVVVNEQALQMPLPTYFDGKEYFVPARAFFSVLAATVLPEARYDEVRRTFVSSVLHSTFNIHSAQVESKQNGTLIRVRTSKQFDTRNVVRYITDNGWLVVQVPEGRVDTLGLSRSTLGGIIRKAWGRQLERSAELRFKLTDKIILPEVYQVEGSTELHIAIRNPTRRKSDRTREMREQWYLDTIVIDPGHGGIDAGTVGRSELMEKTVTLDVAQRLGRLIKRKSNMRVVYTRDEDVFVPLWQRTKIANEAGGKLFISIHVNGVKSRYAHGFETWLLAPANTQEAIEVARLENSVIALEESNHAYQEFSDEALILSTMAQSVWMKESEALAGIIQEQLSKGLDAPNRGVKQAGFLVMIGATMPNVLVETGFISNRIEEQKLAQNEYRQHIAEGLFSAIMIFKEKYEGAMLAEQGD